MTIIVQGSNKIASGLTALPPWAQKQREELAIRGSETIAEMLGREEILSIEETENGYRVLTENFQLEIAVRYLPPEQPGLCGPARFELEPGSPTPRTIG